MAVTWLVKPLVGIGEECQKLRAIAERELSSQSADESLARTRVALAEVRKKKDLAASTMAFAENEDQYRVVADVFQDLLRREKELESELRQAETTSAQPADKDTAVESALSVLDRLGELASDPDNLGSIGELFNRLNVRLFLRFRQEVLKRRRVNKLASGVVTFGTTPPPVTLYEGPTGRRALKARQAMPEGDSGVAGLPAEPHGSGGEGESLGNVNRGERI